jgi:tripartite-type tricarboxylate transporter receptor subunit TctC
MECTKHRAAAIAAAAILGVATSPAWCQAPAGRYPQRPIRLVQPFPPGGGADVAARYVGQTLTERLGQAVVVDNRGGAGGAIGTELAAQAAADGYTLLMATASTIVVNPLMNKVRFDPIRDFDPVAHISTVPLILVVHPSVPAKSVAELIRLAKAQPGSINFASSGDGTISHLAGELFKMLTGTDMMHVPYRGGGPARSALLGGQVQVNFANMLATAGDVRAGRLRALAVSTAKRTEGMPEVPTMGEAGVAQYEVLQWNGMLAPRGVSKPYIELINREINYILELPKTREFFLAGGSDTGGGSPQEFGALIRSDIARWSKVIKQAKLGSNP